MSIQLKDDFSSLTEPKKELLKKTFGGSLTNDELEMFGYVCKQTGLDPFIKQIYPIKRRSKGKNDVWEEKLTIQVGIDGLRSIAERTGKYCPGKEPLYTYDKDGAIISATAYVKKLTPDGTWHEISVTAFMCEYRPVTYSAFWNDKPHVMLGKCAEALSIRKAFPSVTANLYIAEEVARNMDHFGPDKTDTAMTSQPEGQIIDSRPVSASPEAFSILTPLEQLRESLVSGGIAADRLEEWLELLSQKKGMAQNEVVGNLLKVIPSFKKSYTKWLKTLEPAPG